MNLRLVARLLGIICVLIGGFMVFSLPWAHPALGDRGTRYGPHIVTTGAFETDAFLALIASLLLCVALGLLLMWCGRGSTGHLFRKEAMAVVGLSWVTATILGALPFWFSGCLRGPAVRLGQPEEPPLLLNVEWWAWHPWRVKTPLDRETYELVGFLLEGGARGRTAAELRSSATTQAGAGGAEQRLRELAREDSHWAAVLLFPQQRGNDGRDQNYRIAYARMSIVDALFESQSGFSTTGATVLSDLEDPWLVPHCILFWRSSTHFLGGLGIIVLFVVILGQGSAGKALMRAELPGPTQDSSHQRMQHAAWAFASLYCGLNVVLTVLLKLFGLTWFDALCHAFGTMATGGFSTYNSSLGHFQSSTIEYLVIVFMILAGTNFSLLYFLFCGRPLPLLKDVEWRTYMTIIGVVTVSVVAFGYLHGDFDAPTDNGPADRVLRGIRHGLFQAVSIMTTTGYGTADFDQWNHFARGVLLLLMFVGGCAGSTGGGMKVIRHVLFAKIMRLEIEQSFHPSVVRPLRVGGQPVTDPNLKAHILVYFCIILILFTFSWVFVITVEPDASWGTVPDNKLIDSASAVAATLNNIGPGLGIVGATQNYGHFAPVSKFLFTWLMMLGRVEVFVILCLFVPRFWRST